MSLGCALDKTELTQHDALTLSFVTKNNSTVDLTEVKLSLYEVVEFQARHKKSKIHQLVTKVVFKPEELKGTKKLSKVVDGENDTDLFKILNNSREDEMKNFCTFLIRPDINPSYGGKNIRVKHQVELTLMTAEMYTNPEVTASIKILPSADIHEDGKNSGTPSVSNPVSKKTVVFPGKLSQKEFVKSQSTLSAVDDSHSDGRPDLFRSPSNSSIRFEKSQKSSALMEKENTQKIYPVSFEGILEAMDDTYIDRTLLEGYLKKPELGYKPILLNLTSKQFGTIVGEVNYTTDQPAVAEMLAAVLDEKFTCEYVASACRLAESANRADIVKETAQYIVDLKKNRSIIDACLSDFDKVMVSEILNEAAM